MLTSSFALAILLAITSCVSSHVPKGKYLLKKNTVSVDGAKMDESSMLKVVRQQPNAAPIGIRMRLWIYYKVDSVKVEERKAKILQNYRKRNKKRLRKEIRINTRRRNKAIRKGNDVYFYRKIELRDTVNPRKSFKERLKYKFGEAPVYFDSSLFYKSEGQLNIFLHHRGYYYGKVTGTLDTNSKKPFITANYHVKTGPGYFIDSVILDCPNASVEQSFEQYLKKKQSESFLNPLLYRKLFLKDTFKLHIRFDEDVLSDYRTKIAKHMRDDAYYGFSPTNVQYSADTATHGTMGVILTIKMTDRIIRDPDNPDEVKIVPFAITTIGNVYMHIADTVIYNGSFKDTVRKLGINLRTDNYISQVDTLFYWVNRKKVQTEEYKNTGHGTKHLLSVQDKNLFGHYKDSIALDPFRQVTFTYNGHHRYRRGRDTAIMFTQPGLLETQNYLEHTHYYKDYYIDRSYQRLLQLDLFQLVKPVLIEKPGNIIEVHYYLIPAKKQSYSFEPRATNSNGFLGVSASVNYHNKNLFRAGYNTTISFSGGFESQPAVFSDGSNTSTQQNGRSFNTFEIGPTFKLDMPGLWPVNIRHLDKRKRPRTVVTVGYNYQNRPDFSRGVFSASYLYKFYVSKTQVFSVGLPTASGIKFVAMHQSPAFALRINELNDLFLKNAYSDQFIWEDLKLVFDFDNQNSDKKPADWRIVFNTTFDAAGNFLYYGFRKQQAVDSVGHYQLFGVNYSQFALIDNKFITYYDITRKHTLAMRVQAGYGQPYGNTTTSLPYDYAFYAGGSNDNRGWSARTLGPGSYKYYLDPKRTLTQIGDIRLGTSIEYRLGKGRLLQSAIFADANNIWTVHNDPNREGGQFSRNWYKELGVTVGYGIRLDFSFFIFRLDLGLPISNPGLPLGERWIWNSHDVYHAEIDNAVATGIMTSDDKKNIPNPYALKLNFGIGLPF